MRLTGKPAQLSVVLQAMADSHLRRGDYQNADNDVIFAKVTAPPVTRSERSRTIMERFDRNGLKRRAYRHDQNIKEIAP